LILFNESFYEIEKIKTIGSTYMAASGLATKRDNSNEVEVDEASRREQVVLSMVEFAVAMMETLERFNKDALQELRLRIGIAVGPVIAGVVGASKPQCTSFPLHSPSLSPRFSISSTRFL
jgi:class 3 adenylate cyclase